MSLKPTPRTRTHDLRAPTVFGVFTLLGCGYIVFSKVLGVGAVLVTVVPVLLMLGYAAMVVLLKGLRLRDDQAGDNLYYMGFIFTLTSLAISLSQYSSGASVNQIIENFGIAVGSTIAGIALRIFFNQMRRDPMDVEAAARLELSDAAKRVRRELDGVIQELAHFRRTNQQMIEEGHAEVLKLISETGVKAAEVLRGIVELGGTGIRGAAETAGADLIGAANRLSEPLKTTSTQVETLATALEAASQSLTRSISSLVDRIDQSKTPAQVVEVSIHQSIDELKAVISEATALIQLQMQETRRSTEWIGRLNAAGRRNVVRRTGIFARLLGGGRKREEEQEILNRPREQPPFGSSKAES